MNIRFVVLFQCLATVGKRELGFRGERDVLVRQFNLHALLIHWLQEAAALVLVHVETTTNDGVTLFFVNEFSVHGFARMLPAKHAKEEFLFRAF